MPGSHGDCLEKKAHEAADELNEFRKKPEDKMYTVGGWGFDAAASAAASAVVPGAGAVFGGVVRTGEKAVGKALAKKAGRGLEEIVEHTDEAAARGCSERQRSELARRRLSEPARAQRVRSVRPSWLPMIRRLRRSRFLAIRL